MAIRKGIFKVRNTATGEKDEVMLKTTIEQVADLDKLTGATANAAGVWGLAPAPAKGSQNLPLCGDAKYKVLPVEGGGTGANTVAAAVKALLGSSAVGSSTKSIYYDGATLKACADSIGGGDIVAALLEQNGYVKFANGLILQWGFGESPYATPTTYTYPLAYSVNALNVVIGSVGGRESTCRINSVSKDSFIAYRHYSGSGTGSGDMRRNRHLNMTSIWYTLFRSLRW